MSLLAYLTGKPESGLNTTGVAPVTEGIPLAVKEAETEDSFFSWGLLDDLATTVQNGVSQIAQNAVSDTVAKLRNGPEASLDTTGYVLDQPGNVQPSQNQQSFFEKNKMMILVGGGVAVAIALVALKK